MSNAGLDNPFYIPFKGRRFYQHIECAYNISFFNAIARHQKPSNIKMTKNSIIAQGKKLFAQIYEIDPLHTSILAALKSYEGLKEGDAQIICEHFHFNAELYFVKPNFGATQISEFNIKTDEISVSEEFPTYKFIVFELNGAQHVDPLFSDFPLFPKRVCPHCNKFTFIYTPGCHFERWNSHVKECEKLMSAFKSLSNMKVSDE